MLLYSVHKPSRSYLLPFCASPIFHFLIQNIFHLLFSPFLWSVMIVECILWCRLVYIHAKKSDGIYCIPWQIIVFALSLYEVQCFMNMHFLIALCTKVCYYGNFVFKNMNNSEISHHPVHPFPMVKITSNLYSDLAYDSTLCLQ